MSTTTDDYWWEQRYAAMFFNQHGHTPDTACNANCVQTANNRKDQ